MHKTFKPAAQTLRNYPIFYGLFFAGWLSYLLAMWTQSGNPTNIFNSASSNIAIGAQLGLLGPNVTGGPPLWVPGQTCLALPPQYDLDLQPTQRATVPLIYGLMHSALFSLALLPLPMCHAVWVRVVTFAPAVRTIVPVDHFEVFHRLLGTLALGAIAGGAVIWAATMIPACLSGVLGADGVTSACAAFELNPGDPLRAVAMLRLILAPLWLALLPMMAFAEHDWAAADCKISAKLEEAGSGWLAAVWVRAWSWFAVPALGWVVLSAASCGMSLGVLLTFYFSGFDGRFGTIGGVVGMAIAGVGGHLLSRSASVRVHWWEVCYWSHLIIAYGTVPLALVARFDVFWPCIPCWVLLFYDRFLMRLDTRTMFVQARACRCIEGDGRGRSPKLRLVLRAERRATTAALRMKACSNWVYLRVPHIKGTDMVETTVLRSWHPFSLGAHAGDTVELLIDVRPAPVSNRPTFTSALYEHVQTLIKEDNDARKLADRAAIVNKDADEGEDETALAMREITRRGDAERRYDMVATVEICGPFGAAFSRCFNMNRRKRQHEESAFDIVILYGSGLGVPSAIAALSEFMERRRDGTQVPGFVQFLWQARHPEDLQLCWDSLHRLIFEGGGLWSKQLWAAQRRVSSRGIPLDRREHMRRNGSDEWTKNSELLEWLGVDLHVSKMDEEKKQELLDGYNPLAGVDDRVHEWLTHKNQLKSGYHRLGEQLVRLVALHYEAHSSPGKQAKAPRICVSMCGSHRMLETTRAHIKRAQQAIRDELGVYVPIACELAVDSQGSGGGGAAAPPKTPPKKAIAPAASSQVPTVAPAMPAAKVPVGFTGTMKNLLSGVGGKVMRRHKTRTMPKPSPLPPLTTRPEAAPGGRMSTPKVKPGGAGSIQPLPQGSESSLIDQATLLAMPLTIIIFGATGDLAKKKLFPALYQLIMLGHYPRAKGLVSIVGYGRKGVDLQAFIAKQCVNIKEDARLSKGDFCALISFHAGPYDADGSYEALNTKIAAFEGGRASNRLFFLSVPPTIFGTVSEQVSKHARAAEGGFTHLMIEKPFGRDTESFTALNAVTANLYREEQLYRLDHYLGKEVILNIPTLRWGNQLFEPLVRPRRLESILDPPFARATFVYITLS